MSCHDRQMDQETGEKQQETRRLRREQRHSTFALVEARHPLTTNIVTETMTVPEKKGATIYGGGTRRWAISVR